LQDGQLEVLTRQEACGYFLRWFARSIGSTGGGGGGGGGGGEMLERWLNNGAWGEKPEPKRTAKRNG
jgi:hypothetical protein